MSSPYNANEKAIELSIVMPCLNEENTVATCIQKARDWLNASGVSGEIIVGDNGSTDNSINLATDSGARIIKVSSKGYGSALFHSTQAARGKYVIFGDADDSYNFSDLSPFLQQLRYGADLVMGNRFAGGIEKGAMPWKNRYLGNPILSGIGRLFFNTDVKDFHCGLRGLSKAAFNKMDLKTSGMEYASEMVIKASILNMKVVEVPTTLKVDGRGSAPHLQPWRDGWRHLRFMLLYSPKWLFWYPGLFLLVFGLITSAWLLTGPKTFSGITLDIHSLLYAQVCAIAGFQALSFGVLTRKLGLRLGILPHSHNLESFDRRFQLEKTLAAGFALVAAGMVSLAASAVSWAAGGFSELIPAVTMRIAIPSAMIIIIGLQTIFFGFCFGFMELGIRSKEPPVQP